MLREGVHIPVIILTVFGVVSLPDCHSHGGNRYIGSRNVREFSSPMPPEYAPHPLTMCVTDTLPVRRCDVSLKLGRVGFIPLSGWCSCDMSLALSTSAPVAQRNHCILKKKKKKKKKKKGPAWSLTPCGSCAVTDCQQVSLMPPTRRLLPNDGTCTSSPSRAAVAHGHPLPGGDEHGYDKRDGTGNIDRRTRARRGSPRVGSGRCPASIPFK